MSSVIPKSPHLLPIHLLPTELQVVPVAGVVERTEPDLASRKGLVDGGHHGRLHVVEVDPDRAVFRASSDLHVVPLVVSGRAG